MPNTPTSAEIAAGIQTWLRCESPSSSPQGIAAMAAMVAQHAKAAGLAAQLSSLGDMTGPLLHISNRAAGVVLTFQHESVRACRAWRQRSNSCPAGHRAGYFSRTCLPSRDPAHPSCSSS